MAEMKTYQNGELCWYELTTQNVDAAKEFYQGLFGWNLEKSNVSPVDYTEIHNANQAIGGMMQINEQWGEGWQNIPAHWMTYIAVDSCDETIEKIKSNGGNICVPPFDVPNVGRMSVVNDPSGATFSIIQFVSS
ncbi:MAG: VOC family protein [Acidobacteriota bacterium]